MSAEAGRPPLRIILAPTAYYPHVGGIEELTRQLALHLEARGHRALVVTNRWPAGTVAQEVLDGVHVARLALHLPAASPRSLARFAVAGPLAAAGLLRLVRRFRPDVLHLIGAGPNAAYAAALRRVARVPVVLSAQGEFLNDAHRAFEVSRSLRAGLASLLRRADYVTGCSQAVLDELGAAFEISAPTAVLPNAIDPREIELAAPPADDLAPYVLAAGRLVDQKGVDVLLRAFAAVAGDGRGLASHRLVVAGDGPLRGPLEQLAGELAIAERTVFLGSVPRGRLASLLRGADLFAFPSRKEAFGIALLEAMAAGVPAVAARVGGIPEFARDGENALLVPPDDPAALAAALERLASDAALRTRLAEGGRAQAADLTWDRVAPRYEEVYRQVARA